MSSTRLPGKVLAPIAGVPMLAHVASRTRAARTLEQVILATSDEPADDPIAHLCEAHGISCFRGSLNDVLDRYYQAARALGATTIVRIMADCPLIERIGSIRAQHSMTSGSSSRSTTGSRRCRTAPCSCC